MADDMLTAQTPSHPACGMPFSALGDRYYAQGGPTPVPAPHLIHCNAALAAQLGVDADAPSFVESMAGNATFKPGGDATVDGNRGAAVAGPPLASVYAGHQFGVFVPRLGDGRAHLIAELTTIDRGRWELQLKGSGPTPYSRFADGRAVLRSSIREYLCSEAMHALGIPTTRALALVGSPLTVVRETLETAAIVCRAAPSFVRFGHFEYFYHRDEHAELKPLADHVIDTHFPDIAANHSGPERYHRWLAEVIARTARLMTQWQAVGFCHGVMNTDNFSVLGLTLDYGPFGFMDGFDAEHICNHSDEGGRYAWNRQPTIGHWNCSRLLQAALPLLHDEPQEAVNIANALLDEFPKIYTEAMTAQWGRKLGLQNPQEQDRELFNRYLTVLGRSRADFTRSFRRLAEVRTRTDAPASGPREEIADIAAYDAWIVDYRARLHAEQSDDAERAARMNRINPLYVLRNHLVQEAIEQAQRGDYAEIDQLYRLLQKPFDEQPDMDRYAAEPPPDARHIAVSCSS